jgi:hypothetical protein
MRWNNPIPLLVVCTAMWCASAWSTETNSPATIVINGESWINTSDLHSNWALVGGEVAEGPYALLLIALKGDAGSDAAGPGKSGHYRLWSQVTISAQTDSNGVLSASIVSTDMDAGRELGGAISADVHMSPTNTMLVKNSDGSYSFTYNCWGAPNPLANLLMDWVHFRTSINIWHTVSGTISVPCAS